MKFLETRDLDSQEPPRFTERRLRLSQRSVVVPHQIFFVTAVETIFLSFAFSMCQLSLLWGFR